jgi:hypothetical protein
MRKLRDNTEEMFTKHRSSEQLARHIDAGMKFYHHRSEGNGENNLKKIRNSNI